MKRLTRLQLVGPSVLFGAILAAEVAAWALSIYPSSTWLWYVNLELFNVFQRSYYKLTQYFSIPYLPLLLAIAIFSMAWCGYVLERRLPIAIAGNLSFVYAGLLGHAWLDPGNAFTASSMASLVWIRISPGPNLYLVAFLLGTSFASFIIPHIFYLTMLLKKPKHSPDLSFSRP
jgi:hypothetical protein